MKRLLVLFAVCSLLAACQSDPEMTLDPSSLEFDGMGGSQTLHITANHPWNSLADDEAITVSPDSGAAGSMDVTISLAGNTGGSARNFQVIFVCSSKDMATTRILSVKQLPLL